MMTCEQRESHGNVWEKSIPDRGPEAEAKRPQCGGDRAAGNKVREGVGIIGGLVSISSILALIGVKWGPKRQRDTWCGLARRKYSRARVAGRPAGRLVAGWELGFSYSTPCPFHELSPWPAANLQSEL